jgi:hypothetical protein
MKRSNKEEETALIKINPELYKQVREFVKQNKLEFPSIKYFVEKSIQKSLGFKKYDIEGIDTENNSKKALVDVVGKSNSNMLICPICSRVYRKDKSESEGLTTCPTCSQAITNVIKSIRDEKESRRKEKQKENLI